MLHWLKSPLVGGHQLGPLETQLLRALWQRGDATVRELLEDTAIQGAYTTVMTTLDRLHKKGLLDRVLDGRAFRYRPKQTEDEYNRQSFANDLEKLLSSGCISRYLLPPCAGKLPALAARFLRTGSARLSEAILQTGVAQGGPKPRLMVVTAPPGDQARGSG